MSVWPLALLEGAAELAAVGELPVGGDLYPGSEQLMGREIGAGGFHQVLFREVPDLIPGVPPEHDSAELVTRVVGPTADQGGRGYSSKVTTTFSAAPGVSVNS
ncbi:hypothetical protein ABZT04_13170 [Streptomyces sp. NPDC005492]|uniref:hypothetical protein n=1 Tax=Streptomyces sp. NPDC005492 TaxID=3156883 RepID=UPI0033B34218